MRRSPLLRDFLFAIVCLWITFSLCSCGNARQLMLMQGKFDTAKLSIINPVEPIIRKGDILSIVVYSDNPDATKIYNQSVITTSGVSSTINSGIGGVNPTGGGYQVDEDGNIVFQGLGKIKVEGLTKAVLKDTLDVRLVRLLKNPYYSIRFLNYKFTMMGEVNRPGIISIPGERVNILEAIAMAGDLTFYARRDSVLVIRENNNRREFARLDLRQPQIMASPYFYIQQNDIIIFEPTNRKVAANDVVTTRNISLALAIISTIAVIYSIFRP